MTEQASDWAREKAEACIADDHYGSEESWMDFYRVTSERIARALDEARVEGQSIALTATRELQVNSYGLTFLMKARLEDAPRQVPAAEVKGVYSHIERRIEELAPKACDYFAATDDAKREASILRAKLAEAEAELDDALPGEGDSHD